MKRALVDKVKSIVPSIFAASDTCDEGAQVQSATPSTSAGSSSEEQGLHQQLIDGHNVDKGKIGRPPKKLKSDKAKKGRAVRLSKKTQPLAATIVNASFADDTDSDDSDYKPSSDEEPEVKKEVPTQDSTFNADLEFERMQAQAAGHSAKQPPCRVLNPLLQSLQRRHPKPPKDRSQKAFGKLIADLRNYGRVYEDGESLAISAKDEKRQVRAEDAALQASSSSSAASKPQESFRSGVAASLNSGAHGNPAKLAGPRSRRYSPPRSRLKDQKVGKAQEKTAWSSGIQKRENGQEISVVEQAHREWKETRMSEEGLYNHRSVIETQDFLARVAGHEKTAERKEQRKARHAAEDAVIRQEEANKRLELAKVDDEEIPGRSSLESRAKMLSGMVIATPQDSRGV